MQFTVKRLLSNKEDCFYSLLSSLSSIVPADLESHEVVSHVQKPAVTPVYFTVRQGTSLIFIGAALGCKMPFTKPPQWFFTVNFYSVLC